jgi:selenocysteine lyase/cysteine desulfurase
LTTTEEFYGIVRVLHRLKEIGNLVTEVPVEPFEDLSQKLYEEACKEHYDVLILSHVFFKSGNAIDDLAELITKLKGKVDKIIIDGSGAFGNISIEQSLGSVMDDIYYIGGVMKFLGAGEGFSFMSLPKECTDRPVITGWVFGDITDEKQYYSDPVHYAEDGDRYSNSTLEASIWVRTNEIMEYFNNDNFTVEMKNKYTRTLQDYMMKKIEESNISFLSKNNLVTKFGKWRPLQTCFDLKGQKITAKELVARLADSKIFTDSRGDRIRLCVAIYHTIFDIDFLVEKIKEIDEDLKQETCSE